MKRTHCLVFCVLMCLLCFASANLHAARYMEKLDRGVVAVFKGNSQIYISWRMFGIDPSAISFNVYRGSTKINSSPITNSTNYTDTNGSASSKYSIRPVINGVEQTGTNPVTVWTNQYLNVPLRVPAGGTTQSGSYTYSPNDASVGDVDGDGQYEIILKWDPSNSKDNSQSGHTGNVYLDAYEIDGTFLWRIDLGKNIRAGAHYTQFMVYDFDSDGRSEVACKTADGTVDGVGTVIGDPVADWRNSSGYILSGPEYFTVFDGQTGAALDTEPYAIPRGSVSSWGDSYGNRVDRFLACVAYLDGQRPSIVMCRGYYTRVVLAAWNFRDGKLSQQWVFDSDDGNSSYRGQGNHNLSVGDVDGDGFDEIMYGACAIDHDGTGFYLTGYGHGDAIHLSDLDPSRPGQEVFTIHEGSGPGSTFRDANTGEILWETEGKDVGRGVSADIDARYPGAECWGFGGLRSCTGTVISSSSPSSSNFLALWDGDLLTELLNSNTIKKHGGSTLLTASGCSSNNSTKSNPALSADILGDWREEVIWRTSDNQSLRIYTTTDVTTHRIYTLMHDPQYRLSVAWQNVAYNQPPHTGFYIGDGMDAPPTPDIQLVDSSSGGLLREWWFDVAGNTVSDLTADPDYPNNPDGWNYLQSSQAPSNWAENHGTRLRGYLIPPSDGQYTFWVAADDSAELLLSTDAISDNATLIASVPAYTGSLQWNKYPQQQSAVISLKAGRKYYIEMLYKEGTRDDHFAVSWQGPGISQQIIEAGYLMPWTDKLIGDLTADWSVSDSDLHEFFQSWLYSDCETELNIDFNGDCVLDIKDFALLAQNWLVGIVDPVIQTLQIQENKPGFLSATIGKIESDNTGYTGVGFANTDNVAGNYIEWAVNAPVAESYDLQWRYANGGVNDRPATVSVGGAIQASSISFASTGSWMAWTSSSLIAVNLNQGNNVIRLISETSDGLANIDWIEVTGLSPLPGL